VAVGEGVGRLVDGLLGEGLNSGVTDLDAAGLVWGGVEALLQALASSSMLKKIKSMRWRKIPASKRLNITLII
jgi:hypothetical protein